MLSKVLIVSLCLVLASAAPASMMGSNVQSVLVNQGPEVMGFGNTGKFDKFGMVLAGDQNSSGSTAQQVQLIMGQKTSAVLVPVVAVSNTNTSMNQGNFGLNGMSGMRTTAKMLARPVTAKAVVATPVVATPVVASPVMATANLQAVNVQPAANILNRRKAVVQRTVAAVPVVATQVEAVPVVATPVVATPVIATANLQSVNVQPAANRQKALPRGRTPVAADPVVATPVEAVPVVAATSLPAVNVQPAANKRKTAVQRTAAPVVAVPVAEAALVPV